MTRVSEFDTFYDATHRHVLHLTYALCGDRQTAAAATQEAYRRAWQHWRKLRTQDPVQYVRRESDRISGFSAGTHPWRRRREDDSDTELLAALRDLPTSGRRLLVLQTLGELGLDAAAHDVGVTDEAAMEQTEQALTDLEGALSTDLDAIETRLRGLGSITADIEAPRPPTIRRESRSRSRRRTVVVAAAGTALVVAAGLVVTEGGPLQHRADAQTVRNDVGSSAAVYTASEDQLLEVGQILPLAPERTWQVNATDTVEDGGTKPYSPCAERRFADPHARTGYVRSYAASGGGHESVHEAVEVSRDEEAAVRTERRMTRWYAECASPRMQLTGTYAGGDVTVLRLRSDGSPDRTMNVGITRTGVITTAVVHEVDGDTGPTVKAFARTVEAGAGAVCADSGGPCKQAAPVTPRAPLPSGKDPAFLGVVDLPSVANVDQTWAGTPATRTRQNPAATPCDQVDFQGPKVRQAQSKVFVIPEAQRLPEEFGIAETVARFSTPKAARDFVVAVGDRIDACAKTNLSASVQTTDPVRGDRATGRTWRMNLEVDRSAKIYYRTALVRRGDTVAQVTLSPTTGFDLSPRVFADLGARAGERLTYLR